MKRLVKKTIVTAACLVVATSSFVPCVPGTEAVSEIINPMTITADAATSYTVISPVDDPKYTSWFGETRYINGKKDVHTGIDIVSSSGKKSIYAAEGGKVIKVRNDCGTTKNMSDGYGNVVWILMPDGRVAIYAHMKKGSVLVKEGNTVKAGQKIGTMGESGAAWGVHLHYEMRPSRNSSYGTAINVNPSSKGGSVTYTSRVIVSTDKIEINNVYTIMPAANQSIGMCTTGKNDKANVKFSTLNKKDTKMQWKVIAEGSQYIRLQNISSKKFLDVAVADTSKCANGKNVWSYSKQTNPATSKTQMFAYKLITSGKNSYYRVTLYNTSYSLDAASDNPVNGSNLQIWKHLGNSTQQWVFRKV